MPKNTTYCARDLGALKLRIAAVAKQIVGYGACMSAAEWLINCGHQTGTRDKVAQKVAHILRGYVRGVHPRMRNGGVWRAEEAERIIALLEWWLNPGIISPITDDIWTKFAWLDMDDDRRKALYKQCDRYGLDIKSIPDCMCYVYFTPAIRRRK